MCRILSLLLAVLTLAGCTRAPAQELSAFMPQPEERLVIYTSHKESVYAPIIKEFEQRTGIWVEVQTGGTVTLLERIAAGDSDCDLLFGGGADSLNAYSSCFAPYTSPNADAIAPKYDLGNGLWTPFSALTTVLIYNTKLVRQNAPTGWNSLLDRAWQGRIAFADPTASGSGYTALCTLLQVLPGDREQTLRAFVDNLNGRVLEDSGSVITAVADGSCYIGVTLEETARKAVYDGLDLAVVYPEEGTCILPDGAAVIQGCAHPENAQKFIDFLLAPETQQRLVTDFFRRSIRSDVSDSLLPAPPALNYDLVQAETQRQTLLEHWQELTGEGIS